MKTNTLVYDLLRSKWMINTANLPEYEKLANRFLAGEYKGEPIDRKAFRASYEDGGETSKMQTEEKKAIGYPQINLIEMLKSIK